MIFKILPSDKLAINDDWVMDFIFNDSVFNIIYLFFKIVLMIFFLHQLILYGPIAVARVMMPQARVRLSAGRMRMFNELQALCFLAGANSIFYAREALLATASPEIQRD